MALKAAGGQRGRVQNKQTTQNTGGYRTVNQRGGGRQQQGRRKYGYKDYDKVNFGFHDNIFFANVYL